MFEQQLSGVQCLLSFGPRSLQGVGFLFRSDFGGHQRRSRPLEFVALLLEFGMPLLKCLPLLIQLQPRCAQLLLPACHLGVPFRFSPVENGLATAKTLRQLLGMLL